MIHYHTYFDKIPYKDYRIDDEHNLKIIETFNDFNEFISKSNLSYLLTGSLALSILSKKIFRTWKDIDIVIDINYITDWLSIFQNQNWQIINDNYTILQINNIKTNINIEICNYLPHSKDYTEAITEKNINNINIKISSMDDIFCAKFKKNCKDKDIEDFKFFRRFSSFKNKKVLLEILSNNNISM
jgi:hypothetical protein